MPSRHRAIVIISIFQILSLGLNCFDEIYEMGIVCSIRAVRLLLPINTTHCK